MSGPYYPPSSSYTGYPPIPGTNASYPLAQQPQHHPQLHPSAPQPGPSQQPAHPQPQQVVRTTPAYSSPQQSQQPQPSTAAALANGALTYSDPASLLRIIPLTNYAPTARVAAHLAPHTTVWPATPTSDPAHIYPQYASAFTAMDKPINEQDWEIRKRSQERMAQMLQSSGPSYAGSVQSYANPFDALAQPRSQHPQPFPTSFLPSHFPYQNPNLPPTPTSMTATPPASTPPMSTADYFEHIVQGALARDHHVDSSSLESPEKQRRTRSDSDAHQQQHRMRRESSTPSVSGTPTISRTMSKQLSRVAIGQDSPDPLSLPGPSPSKKQKAPKHVNGSRETSPTGRIGGAKGSSRRALAPAASEMGVKRPSALPHPSPGKMHVVVEIPTRRRESVSSTGSRMQLDGDEGEDSPDELWDVEGDRDDEEWTGSKAYRSPSPGAYGALLQNRRGSKSVKTGEKDLRTTHQKFTSLLEDIFEASDALPAEPNTDDLDRSRFFDRLNRDSSAPLLAPETVERITRYITRIHSGRRGRPSAAAEHAFDEEMLKQLFRLLERVMREAEGIVPFPSDRKAAAYDNEGQKAKGKKKGRKGQSSKSPEIASQDTNGTAEQGIDQETEERGELSLRIISTAAGAAECCLAVLDGEGLSKPLYSEDLLGLAVGLIRSQMSNAIFPVVEGMAGERMTSRYLSHLVQAELGAKQTKSLKLYPFFRHSSLSAIAQGIAAALPHLSSLVSRTDLSFSDTLVIQTVYLAISPLFISEPVSTSRKKEDRRSGKVGWGVMKCMRVEALGCLRGAFAKYNDQRQWIIEEILTSLVKLPDQKAQSEFQVANGTKMSTITALLLQLIQASAMGTASRVKRLRASVVEEGNGGKEGAKEDTVLEEKRICTEATESCFRSASAVAGYLLQRCGQSKASKSTLDTDFKAILDTLITDLLKSLYRPEWPAAALYLNVFSKMFIAALEDQTNSVEVTTIKNIALDHLGSIGARLRAVAVEAREQDASGVMSLDQLKDQIIASSDVPSCRPLIDAHSTVHAYLASASRDDSMFASARDLSIVSWASELQNAIDKMQSVLPKLQAEKTEEALAVKDRLEALQPVLMEASAKVWDGDEDVFVIDEPKQADVANTANIAICRHRPLQNAFDSILRAIVAGMDMPAVALRSKALKALSVIAAVDTDILAQSFVRQAFEVRLSDMSPAVRDAAVDLVGKYVVLKPELAVEYYPHIAQRVADTGMTVRKKVIKLLKEIFPMTQTNAIRVDICCKMVEMIEDADDNIKEMAVKALIELLFASTHLVSATLLVDIVGQYRAHTGPIERALEEIAAVDAISAAGRTVAIVDALVQRLVDATEQPDFDSISHIRAISLLCASKADLIDPQKAAVLLNYVRPPVNSDEVAADELLFRIFRLSVPAMPRTATTFATDLTKKITPMMAKPTSSYPLIKELIGCFCAVVTHLSKDYKLLVGVLKACLNGITRHKSMLAGSPEPAARAKVTQALGMLIYMVALIAEHCNLDQLASENDAVQTDIGSLISGASLRLATLLSLGVQRRLTKQPCLYEYLYDVFREFSTVDMPQQAPIMSLGCLFRTYPDLVTLEETGDWIDGVFASNDQDNHARVLTVMKDFLESEAKKRADHAGQSKDITALIGSTAELTDAGTSTTMVQRHFEHIIAGAKSSHAPTQSAAMDVLAFTVNQGLYHPLQCLPVLVALGTSSDMYLAERALDLHATLHQKHSSLVNIRFLDSVKRSYEYQRTITAEPSGHREGTALLAGWFSMLGEKRQTRLDFIKAIGKAFDYDSAKTTEHDVGLALYVAENLTSFEYRLQEEVMIAIQQLSTTVSTCTPLAQTLERADVEAMDGATMLDGLSIVVDETGKARDEVAAQPLINGSMIVCIALLAKNHLLACYGLSEESKCLKQNTTKKTAMGDRPAVKRNNAVLEVGRIPLVRGMETVRDFKEQQATFLQLLQEDGTVDMDMDA